MHRAFLILELAETLRFLTPEHAARIREALTPQDARRFEYWVVQHNLMSRSLLRAVAAAVPESLWLCTSCEAQLDGSELAWGDTELGCPHCDGDELVVRSQLIPPVPQLAATAESRVANGSMLAQHSGSARPRTKWHPPRPRNQPPAPRRRTAQPVVVRRSSPMPAKTTGTGIPLSGAAASARTAAANSQQQQQQQLDPSGGLPLGFMVRQWQVLRPIGKGGMGTVYLGYDEDLREHSAIKLLPYTTRRNPQRAISRFEREARAYSRLDHPNVVRMRDFVRYDTFDCIVLEWCNGGSLAQRLRDMGPLKSLAEIVELGRHVVAGLAHAHEAGLVHRDVKAENILWRHCAYGTTRWIKIADFGIVRELHADRNLTAPGAVIGTPTNMAPEQVMGEPATTAVDVYALGCVLYQAATGRQPFAGANKAEVLCRHLDEPFPRITERRPELPAKLERLLACMGEKRPSHRPSLDEVDEELVSLDAPAKSGRHITTRRIYARRSTTPLPAVRVSPAGVGTAIPASNGATTVSSNGTSNAVTLGTSLISLPGSEEVKLHFDAASRSRERLKIAYGIELGDDATTALLRAGGLVTQALGQRLARAAQKATLLGVTGIVFDFSHCVHIETASQCALIRTLKRLRHFRVRTALAAAPRRMHLLVEMHGLWPSVALRASRADAMSAVRLASAASASATFCGLP